MTAYLFPDNTVLCNFATVNRLDLLESVLNGRGRWTEAVAYEASRSARHLPDLRSLDAAGWLGEPIEVVDEEDVRRIGRIRRAVFGGTDDQPLHHLGEAETCFVISTWPSLAGSRWISDDRESLRYAIAQGIPTWSTVNVMSEAVTRGEVTADAGLALLKLMRARGRRFRLPTSATQLTR